MESIIQKGYDGFARVPCYIHSNAIGSVTAVQSRIDQDEANAAYPYAQQVEQGVKNSRASMRWI